MAPNGPVMPRLRAAGHYLLVVTVAVLAGAAGGILVGVRAFVWGFEAFAGAVFPHGTGAPSPLHLVGVVIGLLCFVVAAVIGGAASAAAAVLTLSLLQRLVRRLTGRAGRARAGRRGAWRYDRRAGAALDRSCSPS